MTTDPAGDGDEDLIRTQAGALNAMLAVAREQDVREFATVPDYCDDEVLRQLVALAWRHQFDESRVMFRRGVAELQSYVSGLIKRSARGSAPDAGL